MIPNFWSLLLPFEFILCKNWSKPHFLSNDYLFCLKLSHFDKVLSFLYAQKIRAEKQKMFCQYKN